jgi:hypothetical protein
LAAVKCPNSWIITTGVRTIRKPPNAHRKDKSDILIFLAPAASREEDLPAFDHYTL